jgi:hypothetical protein
MCMKLGSSDQKIVRTALYERMSCANSSTYFSVQQLTPAFVLCNVDEIESVTVSTGPHEVSIR